MHLTHHEFNNAPVSILCCIAREHELTRAQQSFMEFYDARTGLRPRAFMPKLKATDFQKGDVVVAECVCERHGEERSWSVTFDLLCVALLARCVQ